MVELSADKEELLYVLDDDGNSTGKLEKRSYIHEHGLFHNEIALWIIDKENKKVLLQRRSPNKIINPNKFGLCAGHVVGDDTIEQTVFKETMEELGLDLKNYDIKFLAKLKRIETYQKCFSYHFYIFAKLDLNDLNIQKEELTEIFYIDYETLKQMVENQDKNISEGWKKTFKPIFEKLDEIILN